MHSYIIVRKALVMSPGAANHRPQPNMTSACVCKECLTGTHPCLPFRYCLLLLSCSKSRVEEFQRTHMALKAKSTLWHVQNKFTNTCPRHSLIPRCLPWRFVSVILRFYSTVTTVLQERVPSLLPSSSLHGQLSSSAPRVWIVATDSFFPPYSHPTSSNSKIIIYLS